MKKKHQAAYKLITDTVMCDYAKRFDDPAEVVEWLEWIGYTPSKDVVFEGNALTAKLDRHTLVCKSASARLVLASYLV